jgi:hypothetical protein
MQDESEEAYGDEDDENFSGNHHQRDRERQVKKK